MTRVRPEHKRRLALFGTDVRLLVSGPQNVAAEAEVALTRIQAQLVIVHRTLTRFEPDSELSLLNAHAGEWVPISPTMMQALRAALLRGSLAGRVVLQRHGGALILDSGELVLVDGIRAASPPLTAQRRSA